MSYDITTCAGGRHNVPPPLQVDPLPFDLESGARVTCDVDYSVPILVFLGLCSRLRPDERDRQMLDMHHRLMPLPYGGGA